MEEWLTCLKSLTYQIDFSDKYLLGDFLAEGSFG